MLTVFDNPTIVDVILDRADCGTALTAKNLMPHHENGMQKIAGVHRELNSLLERCRVRSSSMPDRPIVGAEIGRFAPEDAALHLRRMRANFATKIAENFVAELDGGLKKTRVGRIQWESETTCDFDFFTRDKSNDSTMFTRIIDVRRKSHTLVNAKKHRLPASHLAMPQEAKQVIEAMPPWMTKFGYVVTGDRIRQMADIVAKESERTGLGTFVDEVTGAGKAAAKGMAESAKAVANSAQAVAHGISENAVPIAVGAGAIGLGVLGYLALAGKLIATAVVADPALVLGEYVFVGWD
jgi:hypothetical protein